MKEENQKQEQDWRLAGKEHIFLGAKLYWKTYWRYSETWDHDHCIFCWAKFMDADYPDALRAGYVTEDDYTWVCETCFNDFKDRYQWIVEKENS